MVNTLVETVRMIWRRYIGQKNEGSEDNYQKVNAPINGAINIYNGY